ncbi:PAS domain S-box protein [Catalinimonas niigatensis]|uniref:PAS domain S-box protein n=1 Tax=Catalinimonas niigatensis TaxID=1397264 RepID=UPI0026652BCB|nr:PAS domain S-box protein [Catalinimonas niigatensis]WPP51221.1 PAS domain S-box protein [Catalinimonas niigatensis]
MKQHFLSTIVTNSPLIFFEVDQQGLLLSLNKSWSEHTGYALSESLGKMLSTYLDDESQQKFTQILSNPLSSEEQQIFTAWLNGVGQSVAVEVCLSSDSVGGSFGGYMMKLVRHSHQEYDKLLSHFNESQRISQTGSWVYTMETRQLWWSDECSRLFGLKNGVTFSKTDQIDGLAIEERERINNLVREAIQKKETIDFKYTLQHQDGSKRLMRTVVSTEEDEKGNITSIRGITQDITDSVELKEKLLESESRFRMLAEYSQDVISVFDPNLKLTYITPSVKRMLGYSQEEMMQLRHQDFLTEESFEGVMKMHRSRTSYDQILTGEFEFIRKDGTKFWGGIVSSGMLDEEGKFIGYILTTRDIDEKIKIRQRLEESQHKLQEAQTIARMGSYEFDYINRKAIWSEQMYEILHLPKRFRPEAATLNLLLHPEDKARIEEKFFCLPENGEVNHADFRICLPDGEVIYVTGMNKTYLDREGKPLRAIGIIQNITQRKLAEQRIEKQNAELIKVNKEMDHLIYSSSHDLRSPLASALGLLQIIKLEKDQKKQAAYLELMHKCLIKLDTFTKEILDLFKNARSEPQAENVDLHHIIEEVFEEHQYMEGASLIHFEKKIDVPQRIHADRKRLVNIISNLFSNAIRYHKYNQEKPFVKMEASILDENILKLTISDNGQGISKEHQDKVFDMFYRAHPEKKGSGLGLYLVKETVEKLGGQIMLESDYGKGASFTVIVPLQKPSAS